MSSQAAHATMTDDETAAFAEQVFERARQGDAEMLERLLASGLPANLRNHKGDTLLMLASYHGHHDAVRVLRLEGDRLKGSDPLTVAEATSGLTKQILDMRTLENVYVANSSDEAATSWSDLHGNVTTIGSNLKIWLNDDQQASMDKALVELERGQ